VTRKSDDDRVSDDMERLRSMVGMDSEPYENELERSAIRKYAEAIQDSNPVYVDEAYGKLTPHGGIIAPPTFLCTLQAGKRNGPTPIPQSYTEVLNGGVEFLYCRVVRFRDVLIGRSRLAQVFEKEGRLGRMLFLVNETLFRDREGGLVARMVQTGIRYSRPTATATSSSSAPFLRQEEASKDPVNIPKLPETQPTDPSDWLKPRYFDDVREGESLPPLAKRPTQRHLVMYAGASGNYLEYHYDREYAARLGMPGVILHGNLKIAYLGQLVTDWIGAHGTVLKLAARIEGMDLLGDTCVAKGTVTTKVIDRGVGKVGFDLELYAPDGRRTVTGTAIAALPLKSSTN
jgi:acyl dehydratase